MDELIRRAREGDREAMEALLREIRPKLKQIAEWSLDRQLWGRFDASDVVQQTLMEAMGALGDVVATTDQGVMAWLRTALERDMDDLVRKHVVARMRSVRSERPLDAPLPGGATLRDRVQADCSTPSRAAVRNEEKELLHEAIAKLTPDQAEAVRMRHLENLPLEEIAARMNRPAKAVSALIFRGMKSLRVHLKNKNESRS